MGRIKAAPADMPPTGVSEALALVQLWATFKPKHPIAHQWASALFAYQLYSRAARCACIVIRVRDLRSDNSAAQRAGTKRVVNSSWTYAYERNLLRLRRCIVRSVGVGLVYPIYGSISALEARTAVQRARQQAQVPTAAQAL